MSNTHEIYACLYVPEFPAQAVLRLRPDLQDRACVVMEGTAPAEQVIACNRRARQLGVACGMTRVDVELFPHITPLARSHAMEDATAAAVLECASSFSPRVEVLSTGTALICALDIAGTQTLFGPPEILARNLHERLRTIGMEARITASANLHAAVCMARGMRPADRVAILPRGKEASLLAPLPVDVLALSSDQAETFALWGIRTLGMLATLPKEALVARMGQAAKRLHALARGEWPHLLQPIQAPFQLIEKVEFDAPIDALESLLFVLNTMLDQLIERARARMLVLATVTVTLSLEGGAMATNTVRPALPTSDKPLWLKLLQLELEAHPPEASMIGITMQAEPGVSSKVQMGLFSPQTPDASRLDVTLARLRALVGEDHVGRAMIEDSPAPDRFHMEPFSVAPSPAKTHEPERILLPRLTLRRLRPPEPARVTVRQSQPAEIFFREQKYIVDRVYGPWKIDGEWWTSTLWGEEQWDVVLRSMSGGLLCACLVRDCMQNHWHMAALYD
ncbi:MULTISPECIES: DNA polymerase Y family protein [Acidobacterium]|uniref:UmuC domain-containing protein n=1 Tax=Acidobacterium capsulatum (strain ATCC 51196 / DSM 11244 / BCRC 80197 / JCM 7670 / NBRC 15755 / NCIMB 13165 / 161) TaxID=240015 RepID=C1F6L3_ACIC5|nr:MULTISPECIES: DNA polymerase Y family protein [Acidobacterium]ACO34027.1 conserved hypothetical protein [Acidobacterium capsulatum ATCC 51196]HCT60901.1 DNA polymerase Y family protein [Acidobacterium sp.]